MNFDYYIYIDYSEEQVGYTIIAKDKICKLLPLISKFHHYKQIKHKRQYLAAIKKLIIKNEIKSFLLRYKIERIRYNALIFANVLEFITDHDNCAIFISVDDNQYASFMKLFKLLPHPKHTAVIKESDLKKGSVEYRLSLVIDSLLNIERMRKSK